MQEDAMMPPMFAAGTLNPADPFTEIFTISNTGALPVNNVDSECVLNEVNYAHGPAFRDVGVRDPAVHHIDILPPNGKLEATCYGLHSIAGRSGIIDVRGRTLSRDLKTADISLFVRYRPAWRPVAKTDQFHFFLVKRADGKARWLHQSPGTE
jgi:hypothetical protein